MTTAAGRQAVSLVTTVFNDFVGCRSLLDTLPRQTRIPDEIIIVDGGSTDGTMELIREAAKRNPVIRLIEAPGVNIGRGRNIGIEAAAGPVIVSTDAGCRLEPNWLEELVKPFEDERRAEFVAGVYRIDPQSLLERVIGLTTMRGTLDPFDPEKFNPSARSMAFTKDVWRRAGGIPDFIDIDDTLFDYKVRRMNVRWVFAPEAVVHWRPRESFRRLYRQFHFYGIGGGHTRIYAESSLYNLRNLALMALLAAATVWQPLLIPVLFAAFIYFYVLTFHRRARRVMDAVGKRSAYVLSILVNWTVLLGDSTGFVVGSVQRLFNPKRYRDGTRAYYEIGCTPTGAGAAS